jgi:hypothetical protein
MVLKLYSVGYARGGSVIVALVLAEKQIPFELIVVNLEANEQKTPEFLEMHPFGQVPVIVSIIPRVFLLLFPTTVTRMTTDSSSMKAAPSAGTSQRNTQIKGHPFSPRASRSAHLWSKPCPSSLLTSSQRS